MCIRDRNETLSNEKRGEKRMKEEDILLKKLGKENSFKVPDGYFENLTSEIMNKTVSYTHL